jgi:hypothetical protein
MERTEAVCGQFTGLRRSMSFFRRAFLFRLHSRPTTYSMPGLAQNLTALAGGLLPSFQPNQPPKKGDPHEEDDE